MRAPVSTDQAAALFGGQLTRTANQDIHLFGILALSHGAAAIISTGGDATRINSVNYSIEDDSQLVKDARARAFNDAKDRAQQYAQLSGLDLGKVISITESGGSTPPPTPMPSFKGAEMAAVPVEPGQQSVGFSVTVIFELT